MNLKIKMTTLNEQIRKQIKESEFETIKYNQELSDQSISDLLARQNLQGRYFILK